MTRAAVEAHLLNIGPKGVAQRRKLAYVTAGLALAGLVAIVLLDLPHRWRGVLIVPLWLAALGWMQAASKT